jgi:hypothetical protein
VNWLFQEYLDGRRRARSSLEMVSALQACGLAAEGLGVGFVEIDPHHYAPHHAGEAAIIVPLFVDGELHDLIATDLQTRSTRTRMGVATVLGH